MYLLKDIVKELIADDLNFTEKYSTEEAICEYLGLGNESKPIGDEWAKKFGYKDRKSFSAQYKQFKLIVDLRRFTIMQLMSEEINSHNFYFVKDLVIKFHGQIGEIVYFQNLFDLMKNNLGLLSEMGLYNTKLNKATNRTPLEQLIIVKEDTFEYYKSSFNRLIQYSKANGLCNFELVSDLLEIEENSIFLELLGKSADVCVFKRDVSWYMFENTNNYIYHLLGKIRIVTEILPIEYVISSIIRTFKERTRDVECPTKIILEEYLNKSKYVTVNSKNMVIIHNVEEYKLSESEKGMLAIILKNKFYSYHEIYEKLCKTQSETTIIKTVFHSPLLCCVKDGNGGKYKLVSAQRDASEVIFDEKGLDSQDILEEIYKIEENHEKYINVSIKARLGQGKYRDLILINRMCKCELCNIMQKEILIASHIKEYVASNIEECIDVNNGLLLCANHDKLFDRHLISFDDSGKIIISKSIEKNDYYALGINGAMVISMIPEREKYMKYHRSKLI